MKKIFLTLLLIGSMSIQAQDLYWEININKAIETSNKTGKPMLLFFTGSDWCGWCIRLQKEVLKTPEFAAWAAENVVLVELDYPRSAEQAEETRRQNNELQQTFGIQGYPTIWIANASKKDGKTNFEQLGNTGYVAGGPAAWLAGANEILKKNPKKAVPAAKPVIKKKKRVKKQN
jgi:protein disulfide-isomerase